MKQLKNFEVPMEIAVSAFGGDVPCDLPLFSLNTVNIETGDAVQIGSVDRPCIDPPIYSFNIEIVRRVQRSDGAGPEAANFYCFLQAN